MAESHVIHLKELGFRWPGGMDEVINIASFSQAKQQHTFLRGPSGSGKTTLLNLITGVLQPQRGDVQVLESSLAQCKPSVRDRYRVDHIGIIFQQFNLLPYLNVLENILLPCTFSKLRMQRASAQRSLDDEAKRLLAALGMTDSSLVTRRASDLSTGQQQRVAAARALIGTPELIIADEPTSALDADTKKSFIKLLFKEIQAANSTLLFVSHDQTLEELFDRSIDLAEINKA